jgi:hypothetical protein
MQKLDILQSCINSTSILNGSACGRGLKFWIQL